MPNQITVEFLPIFREWFKKQADEVQNKISSYIRRLEQGNTSNLKTLREGISEIKIHFGAGVRLYCIKKNDIFYIILWGGSDKKSQQEDIEKAIKIKRFMEANDDEE
jgi:putative addiction module killer protein